MILALEILKNLAKIENERRKHPSYALKIVISVIHGSQWLCTRSEAASSSGAVLCNVCAVLSSVVQMSAYVASWLLNWFKSFSL
jgi:hypothetical protein